MFLLSVIFTSGQLVLLLGKDGLSSFCDRFHWYFLNSHFSLWPLRLPSCRYRHEVCRKCWFFLSNSVAEINVAYVKWYSSSIIVFWVGADSLILRLLGWLIVASLTAVSGWCLLPWRHLRRVTLLWDYLPLCFWGLAGAAVVLLPF